MSLLWFIFVNAIIGVALSYPMIKFIEWYADRKYGIDIFEETAENNLKIVDMISLSRGIDGRVLPIVIWTYNIVLWEIFYPIIIYNNIQQMKELHEVRGGNDRLIIRKEDRKVKALEEDIMCAKKLAAWLKEHISVDSICLHDIARMIESDNDYGNNDDFKKDLVEMLDGMADDLNENCDFFETFIKDIDSRQ